MALPARTSLPASGMARGFVVSCRTASLPFVRPKISGRNASESPPAENLDLNDDLGVGDTFDPDDGACEPFEGAAEDTHAFADLPVGHHASIAQQNWRSGVTVTGTPLG